MFSSEKNKQTNQPRDEVLTKCTTNVSKRINKLKLKGNFSLSLLSNDFIYNLHNFLKTKCNFLVNSL